MGAFRALGGFESEQWDSLPVGHVATKRRKALAEFASVQSTTVIFIETAECPAYVFLSEFRFDLGSVCTSGSVRPRPPPVMTCTVYTWPQLWTWPQIRQLQSVLVLSLLGLKTGNLGRRSHLVRDLKECIILR